MSAPEPAAPAIAGPRGRETWLALLASLLLAALVVGRPLFDARLVYCAVDTATQQLPWSKVVPVDESAGDPAARPRNPGLSDQGMGFYPFYRWVSASWRAGDAPTWNPLAYAGSPGFGNPQYGALDPQVGCLVALDALGGERAFNWGFALLAALRIAAAALGAFLLARELGLSPPGAALAGTAFGLSGYLILWLGFSLGHVPPLLPWILLCLEKLRGQRRPGARARAAAGAAGCMALAVLGGHPETSFYVGALAGLWALALLRQERRAGLWGLGALALGTLAAGASLLPFVEYLGGSAARQVRALSAARAPIDWVALGIVLVAWALVWMWRSARAPAEVHLSEAGERKEVRAVAAWRVGIGLGFALAGAALLLHLRGLSDSAWLALVHDLYGAPGDGEAGFRGSGTYVEEASAWLPLIVLGLASASMISGAGPLRRRKLVVASGLVALLLSLRTPGLLELYQRVPEIGLGATVRLASVSALMLALLAGEGLDAAPRAARSAIGACIVLLFGMPLLWSAPAGPGRLPALETTPSDDLVGFLRVPAAELSGGNAPLEGWLHPSLDCDSVRVRAERLDESGEIDPASVLELPCEIGPQRPALDGVPSGMVQRIPEGALYFHAAHLQVLRLQAGTWRFSIGLYRVREPGKPPAELARRVARVSRVLRPPGWSWQSLALCGLGLALLFSGSPGARGLSWLAVALCALHGLWFARGQNPAVPEVEAFPLTRTEQILARELGPYRYFSDAGVLPPNTGLVRGLRSLHGYDGLDVAGYNEFRRLAMKPGTHALLGWSARGVDLASPAFRLLGVKLLALSARLEAPGWTLIAGPEAGAPEPAEAYVYRAEHPLPRAFVPQGVVPPEILGQILARDPQGWDPLVLGCVEENWRPQTPCTSATVGEPRFLGNREVRVEVELDGDGLLILTEQCFPGWVARVDGERRPIFQADAIFRGLPLEQGRHEVVFRYEPRSVRIGAWLSGLAAAAIAGLLVVGWSKRASASPAAPKS